MVANDGVMSPEQLRLEDQTQRMEAEMDIAQQNFHGEEKK